MAQSNLKDFASIGVDDETWATVSGEEAKALLNLFAAKDSESRTLGTALMHSPNGKELYIAPRLSGRY